MNYRKNILALFLFLLLFIVISPVLPFKNIPKTFIVVSGSMEPAIKSGTLVLTKAVNPKSLKVGDIIAFVSPNNPNDFIIHRISSIKSTNPLRVSTKGDNNNSVDQWDVVESGIKGQYQLSLPYLGKIAGFVRQPLGFILIICFPALIFIISELFKIKKIFIPLFLFASLSSIFSIKSISALYTSAVFVTGLSFSISELSPPESLINLGDINTRNIRNFNINATASDNISVSSIKLYYSFNFNQWQLFPETIYSSEGDFHFSSPDGDGLYSFETIATDSFGNIETKDFNYFNHQIKVDTIPPTTNLNNQSFSNHIYNGQDYLTNGNFEIGITAWIVGSSIGDHHIINNDDTDNNNAFILGSDTKSINGTDSVYQIVSLPASASSTLSFSYRFLSHDIADYDHLNVNLTDLSGTNILENILNFGNLNSDDFDYDSGWLTLSRGLTHFAGQTFKLIFSLTDTGTGDDYYSWTYLDNVKISTLDIRVGETSVINFLATDLGSDIINSTPDTTLNPGENDLTFTSDDSSENIEINHHQSIVVPSPLVLNKITKNTISLFNNLFNEPINLINYFYSIDDGPLISIDNLNLILSTPLPDSCQIKLFLNDNLIDSVNVTNLGSTTWQRISDGLGPWAKINAPPSFNLESRLSVSKITLTVSGLATTLSDMSYTIDFSDISGPQQIYGRILSNTIDSQGVSSRDFYLGTCSSGGTCLPVSGLGSSYVVTFSDLPSKTFIFN